MLTIEQKEFYNTNGYLLIKNLVPLEETLSLRESFERLISKVNENHKKYRTRYTRKDVSKVDTWGVNNILSPELFEESFVRLLTNNQLVTVIENLLGPDIRFWGYHALWSPQEFDYDLSWHRDEVEPCDFRFEPTGRATHLQFNVPLEIDDSFRIIPGSHSRKLYEHEVDVILSRSCENLPEEIVLSCEPGDILFTNVWSVHRGSCKAGAMRRTLHINLQPKSEPFGAHTSASWMRDADFLKTIPPIVRKWMENLISWDDANPISRRELIEKTRSNKLKRNYAIKLDNYLR